MVVHDFEEPQSEIASEISCKEPSFEEILRADFHHAGILCLKPIVDPVADELAIRRSFRAQAKELWTNIDQERSQRNVSFAIQQARTELIEMEVHLRNRNLWDRGRSFDCKRGDFSVDLKPEQELMSIRRL